MNGTAAFSAYIGAILVGQATGAAGAAGETASAAEVQSVWDFILKGGPVIIPIALCSLVALTVVVERLVSLRRSAVIPPTFFSGLRAILKDGIYDREDALAFCKQDASPIAGIVEAGIKNLNASVDRLEKQVEEAGRRQIMRLRKNLRALVVIAAITPLLGLLGTIFGMIDAFQTVAVSGEALGKTELLAKGIYQAMITTAAGLSVAIPVIIAFHWISAKIDSLVVEMDELTVTFIDEYGGRSLDSADGSEASLSVTEDEEERQTDSIVGEGAAVA